MATFTEELRRIAVLCLFIAICNADYNLNYTVLICSATSAVCENYNSLEVLFNCLGPSSGPLIALLECSATAECPNNAFQTIPYSQLTDCGCVECYCGIDCPDLTCEAGTYLSENQTCDCPTCVNCPPPPPNCPNGPVISVSNGCDFC